LKRRGLILAYHRVNSSGKDPMAISVKDFEDHMNYFYERGYLSLTLQEYSRMVIQGNTSKKNLVITFDDGYRDNYLFAFPILRLYGFRGTVFLTADYIGKNDIFPVDKEKNWNNITDEDLPLTWEQVFEMKEYGMEFGSHTCSHRHLDELPKKEIIKETSESKHYLEQKLGSKVTSFCYPSGRFNQQVKEIVLQAGYLSAVVTPRQGQSNEDMFSLKRIGFYSNDKGLRFKFKISPLFSCFRDLGFIYKTKKISGAICQP